MDGEGNEVKVLLPTCVHIFLGLLLVFQALHQTLHIPVRIDIAAWTDLE